MPASPICRLSLFATTTLFLACGSGYTEQDVSAASVRLSHLYDLREYERAMLEGEQWQDVGPDAYEARGWYVLNVSRYSTSEDLSDSAVANGEAMVAEAPENAWAWFALAGALNWHRDRGDEAVAAADSALARSDDLAMIRLHVDAVRSQIRVLNLITRPCSSPDCVMMRCRVSSLDPRGSTWQDASHS